MLILSFRVKVIEFVGDLDILKIIIETHRMREEECKRQIKQCIEK